MDFAGILETITNLFAGFDIQAILDGIMGLVGGLVG